MAVACFQCLWGTLCVILLNMQCRPHRAIWEFYLPSKCYSLPDVMLCSASVQVISDVTMFCLPQKIIWGLQMSLKRRLGISLLFGVGILSVLSILPSPWSPNSSSNSNPYPAPQSQPVSVSPTPWPSPTKPTAST